MNAASAELTSKPDVSVVMAVYNEEDYLEESIRSILCQTYANFEFIIVDDGSNSKTSKLLKQYSLADDRIVIIHNQSNIGLTRSLNKAIRYAQGDYIARQDADDVSMSNRLKKQRNFLKQKPDYVLVSCGIEKIDSKGHRIRVIRRNGNPFLLNWNLLFFNYIDGHSQVMYRKHKFLQVGGYNEAFIFAQDYELWTRLSRIGKFKIMNEVLVKIREHRKQLSSKNMICQFDCILKISQSQIQSVIQEKIPIDEVAKLWSFWTFSEIPNGVKCVKEFSSFDNSRMKQIYTRFVSQKVSEAPRRSDTISKMIGERYLKWFLYELLIRRRFKQAFRYIEHSMEWLGYKTPLFIAKVLSEKFARRCLKLKY